MDIYDDHTDISNTTLNINKKRILSLVLSLISLLFWFINCIQIQFNQYVYNVSLTDIMLSSGFQINQTIVYIPSILQICLIVGITSSLLGTVCLVIKKFRISSISFLICSISPIVMILMAPTIHKSASTGGINEFYIRYFIPLFLITIFSLLCSFFSKWILGAEELGESIFKILSFISIGAVGIISLYILISGLPAIFKIGVFDFLMGTQWIPKEKIFGIFPLILSSISVTLGAIIIGVPIGVMTAVFLSEILNEKISNIIRIGVQILAGIPSVVYGFFGMLVVVPLIRHLFQGKTIGDSLLAAIIILSIMVLPTIVTISESSLKAVPESYREASLSLGATPTETIFKVTIPAASSGILSGIILGVGRAIGETMAVIMVSGNVVNLPRLLSPVRFLTTGIVLEMSYSSGLHRQALFAIGLVLFIFIMIVNITFIHISTKGESNNAK